MIASAHYIDSVLIRKPSPGWIMHNTLRIDRNDDLNSLNIILSCTKSMSYMDNLVTLKYIL
jgi:hypothetical protein